MLSLLIRASPALVPGDHPSLAEAVCLPQQLHQPHREITNPIATCLRARNESVIMTRTKSCEFSCILITIQTFNLFVLWIHISRRALKILVISICRKRSNCSFRFYIFHNRYSRWLNPLWWANNMLQGSFHLSSIHIGVRVLSMIDYLAIMIRCGMCQSCVPGICLWSRPSIVMSSSLWSQWLMTSEATTSWKS